MKKRRRSIGWLFIILCAVFLIGIVFNLKASFGEQKGPSKADIDKAKKALKVLLWANGNDNPALNLAALVLEQPELPSFFSEHGFVAGFDKKDEPAKVVTTKTYDYFTGTTHNVEELTAKEILRFRKFLKKFHKDFQAKYIETNASFCMSNGFKAAMCEWLIYQAEDRVIQEKTYLMQREGQDLKIYVVEKDKRKLLAAERIFFGE